ncbi:MAG: TonB-dependent receptor [Chitinophagaceae bacterium]|nr:MAG: TonB-dependent receptor [Chitinophagaceae bacterium]
MLRKIIYFIGFCFLSFKLMAQTPNIEKIDSVKNIDLENVVVVSQQHVANKKTKILSSLDSYLESHPSVNMIKRGAYAWEPSINGMSTERSIITIDGMRIYGACTDKMDPITSYVEITNLSKANIQNGQSGSAHGATIAGGIDLVRRKSGFNHTGFKGSLFSGIESNNFQKILGTTLQYSAPTFFSDIDFTYRDANNYKAGGGETIDYSQFTKYNLSAISGFKLNHHSQITASLIYDKAVDIGYPALPMDVALAEAIIGSLQFEKHHIADFLHHWETKLYYNQVTHVMDDSKRPFVPIRMDMPGWSKTGGYYSKVLGKYTKHNWMAQLSGHYNYSLAEMTMFSNKPDEKDMFMLTWPGVATINNHLFIEDKINHSKQLNATLNFGIGNHYNQIKDQTGFESLQIFYPHLKPSKNRWLKSLAYKIQYQNKGFEYSLGTAYGERAPSVSEAYGYYLFNSADKYDYLGNPHLKNEKSIELNAGVAYSNSKLSLKWQMAYFNIHDYIIGMPQKKLIPMTIGAKGIKIYESLNQAQIFNTSMTASYQLNKNWQLTSNIIYRRGFSDTLNLPQIQPLTYQSKIQFQKSRIQAEATMQGALAQKEFSSLLGESNTAPYSIFNMAASYWFKFNRQKIQTKLGIENIFDQHYTTFANWNKVPQMGRNVFVNLIYSF